jgi:hypothetical protein
VLAVAVDELLLLLQDLLDQLLVVLGQSLPLALVLRLHLFESWHRIFQRHILINLQRLFLLFANLLLLLLLLHILLLLG